MPIPAHTALTLFDTRAGAPMQPVGVDGATFSALLDLLSPPTIDDPTFPDGWVLYRRSDDWCATA